MIVFYDPDNGPALPDNKIEQAMIEAITKGDDFTIGTDAMLTCFRFLLATKFHDVEASIKFKDYPLVKVQKNGRLERWYTGMGDHLTGWLMEMSACDRR